MKIGQIRRGGQLAAAIFTDSGAQAADRPLRDLIHLADQQGKGLAEVVQAHATGPVEPATPAIPLDPVEVWACGCTYETSAAFRDGEHNTREGFYAHVYRAENRPEVFFKGTGRVCVGPDEPVGIRVDSKFTAPEPELAVILGAQGRVLGYTLANDVSAWDIERENPLYLPQSKTYTACCSLGPYIITADEIPDPRALEMSCTILRGGQELFRGTTSTSRLSRPISVLIEYLLRSNPVPSGSVLLTGTGIIVTEKDALAAGDTITINVPQIGTLSNVAAVV